MPLVTELELPSFDPAAPGLTAERFHGAMAELRASGWLAAGPYGAIVLDREAGEFFLRTRSAIFPGMKIAEISASARGRCSSRCSATSCTSTAPTTRACAAS
ncbi:MAG: hypothetical protein ACYDC2_06075 [Solirubrobacteraceae bacterium]